MKFRDVHVLNPDMLAGLGYSYPYRYFRYACLSWIFASLDN